MYAVKKKLGKIPVIKYIFYGQSNPPIELLWGDCGRECSWVSKKFEFVAANRKNM